MSHALIRQQSNRLQTDRNQCFSQRWKRAFPLVPNIYTTIWFKPYFMASVKSKELALELGWYHQCIEISYFWWLYRGHPRGRFRRKSLPKLADFSQSWAEGEVKMYRMYREIQNFDQNFSLKSWNCCKTSLSESSRMTHVIMYCDTDQ